MKSSYGIASLLLLISCLFWLAGCSPEVGSEEWCANMKEQPKQDWTAKEAGDYAKYCVFRLEKK